MASTQTKLYITAPVEIVCLAALGIIGNLAPFILPVIVGGIVDQLGVTLDQAGYVAFADMCGLGIGALIWSRLILTVNWRVFSAVAVTLVVVGNVASAMAGGMVPLMGARVVVGVGAGLLLAIGNSGLTLTRNPDRTIGVVTVIAMLSASVALFAFPLLIKAFGVAMMFYGMAMVTAVVGLGIFGMTRQSPYAGSEGAPMTEASGATGFGLSKTGALALLGVLLFFVAAIIFWVYVERLGNDAGFDTETIASVLGASHLFGALGAITPAVLGTRFGNRIAPVALCICLACVMAVLMTTDVTPMTYAIAACGFIFAWDCFYPYLMGVLVTLDPSARLVSYGLTVQTIGKAIGPAIAGAIILQVGFGGIYGLCALLFLLSLVALLGPTRQSDVTLRGAPPVAGAPLAGNP